MARVDDKDHISLVALLCTVGLLYVGDAHALTKELTARLDRARAKLATYDGLLADMLDGRDEESFERDSERIGPYLTLMAGRMYEQTNIRWCAAALEVLSSGPRS